MENVRLITSTLQLLIKSLEPSRERSMVLRWKDEVELYGSRREQRQKILDALAAGYDTYAELQAATNIPRSTCMKIVRRLLQDNSITKTFIQKPNRRSELHFELIERKHL